MAITNTRVFPKQIDKDISNIFDDEYLKYPDEYSMVANIGSAPSGGYYKEAELSGFGGMVEIPEGGGISFDSMEEGNEVTRYYTKYGLGAQITREMVQDDVHGNMKVSNLVRKLTKNAAVKADTEFWDLFNNGFATHTAWDGQYIFDASGRTLLKSGAAQNNRPSTDAALSETALQAAFEYFQNAKDSAGNPIILTPSIVIVPVALQWAAQKLLKTDLIVSYADNDINTMNPAHGLVSWKPFVSRFLTSDTAWFMLSREHDFRFWWKWRPEVETADDFNTGNALVKVSERFTTFCNNPIGCYGTTGA